MTQIPCFDASQLQAICKVLGDTINGLTGDDIGYLLADAKIEDTDPGMTKWKRLFNAFVRSQNSHRIGNHVLMFINRAMAPARYLERPELFSLRRDGLNVALSFAGFAVNAGGQVITTSRETTIEGARARATRLQSKLEARGTHPEIFAYCRAELLTENYFHAVLEAVKGLGERLRQLSGLTSDGAELVNTALSTKSPVLALNSLRTETEVSEQKGIANLLIGLFGAVRNPTAHAPKAVWPMPEQDAMDIFALASFVHRKLDTATRV